MEQGFIDEIIKMERNNIDISEITDKIIRDLNINEYPIPIVKIVQALDFIVGKQKLQETFSGYIAIGEKIREKFGKDRFICVNSTDCIGHQRFTIAHELAHFLFDFKKSATYYNTYRTTDSDNKIEKRANAFAANLLMPAEEFRRIYNDILADNEKKIEILMKYFEVSRRAIDLRIIELGLN